jgi:hypothetical protein
MTAKLAKELKGRGIKVLFIEENLTFVGDDTLMANLLDAFAEF